MDSNQLLKDIIPNRSPSWDLESCWNHSVCANSIAILVDDKKCVRIVYLVQNTNLWSIEKRFNSSEWRYASWKNSQFWKIKVVKKDLHCSELKWFSGYIICKSSAFTRVNLEVWKCLQTEDWQPTLEHFSEAHNAL